MMPAYVASDAVGVHVCDAVGVHVCDCNVYEEVAILRRQ